MCILFPLTFRIRPFRYFQCVAFRVTLNGALTSCDVACWARFLILSFIETHGNKEQSEKDRKHNRFLGIEVVIMAKIALQEEFPRGFLFWFDTQCSKYSVYRHRSEVSHLISTFDDVYHSLSIQNGLNSSARPC